MQLINAFKVARTLKKIKLEEHMEMHNGEKPYQCIKCYKPFSKQVNLNVYLRMPTGQNTISMHTVCHSFYIKETS